MSWGQLIHNFCSRCRGTMVKDWDRYGTYLQCLQCGHVIDVDNVVLTDERDLVAKMEKRSGTQLLKVGRESTSRT